MFMCTVYHCMKKQNTLTWSQWSLMNKMPREFLHAGGTRGDLQLYKGQELWTQEDIYILLIIYYINIKTSCKSAVTK